MITTHYAIRYSIQAAVFTFDRSRILEYVWLPTATTISQVIEDGRYTWFQALSGSVLVWHRVWADDLERSYQDEH